MALQNNPAAIFLCQFPRANLRALMHDQDFSHSFLDASKGRV
jgi:hypothetical protein